MNIRQALGQLVFWANWGVCSVLAGIFFVGMLVLFGVMVLSR
jgi:hypothetical protein